MLFKSPKALSSKKYFVVLTIIIVVFAAVTVLIFATVQNFLLSIVQNQSKRQAEIYAENLGTAIESSRTINTQLEEKIDAASDLLKVNHLNNGTPTNEMLAQLAYSLKVDEIYCYDKDGKIVSSSSGEFIGYEAEPGHPVYIFMMSNNCRYIGDIRKNTESGKYLKYGYIKVPEGLTHNGFYQIGVLADNVHKLLSGFELGNIMNNMTEEDTQVKVAFFFDNELDIKARTLNAVIDVNSLEQDDISALNDYTTTLKRQNAHTYMIITPVKVAEEKYCSLLIYFDVISTIKIIHAINAIESIAYSLILALIIVLFVRNKKIIKMAYTDALTGLPNKRYLAELIDNEKTAQNEKKALMVINCTNFRALNLTYGYQYGESIIKQLAEKLEIYRPSNGMLFQLSADRFAFYIKDYNSTEEIISLCNKLLEKIREILVFSITGAGIGVYEFKETEGNVDAVKYASIAANNISGGKYFGYLFFNESMETEIKRAEIIKNEMDSALKANNGKFYLEYQPIIDLKTNKVCAFEALARFKSDSLGNISPVEFIPLAEKTRIILPFGRWALITACRFLKAIELQGFTDIKMSVNISTIQLLNDNFVNELKEVVKFTDVNPKNLILEITETEIMQKYEIINQKLDLIRNIQITVALDDFGTGYSSLARESELNINCIKIDKHFIDRIMKSKNTIVSDIISMAHRMGQYTVAEGVEHEEQKQYLIENGCDCFQGYLYSKPLSESNALMLLKNQPKN